MKPCPHPELNHGLRFADGKTYHWLSCHVCHSQAESDISREHALACIRAGRMVEPA